MWVECVYRNDKEREIFDPVLEPGSRRFVFRLYKGDICDPFGGNWFVPPWPKFVWRTTVKLPVLPFIAWKWPFMNRAGYIGFKLYGAGRDQYPQYLNWMKYEDTEPGSNALCFSFRPFANLE